MNMSTATKAMPEKDTAEGIAVKTVKAKTEKIPAAVIDGLAAFSALDFCAMLCRTAIWI